MDSKLNIIISAVIAISLYILLIMLFLLYTGNDIVKKIDTNTKITVLQLEIVLETNKTVKENITIKSGVKVKEIAQKVVKKTTSSSMKEKTDLKSLFAGVSTKAKVIKKKKILNVKKTSISSRFKSKFEKEKKVKNVTLSNLIDNNNNNKPINKMVLSQSNNESDPYFSKINQLLSSRWNPMVFSNDLQAKIIVTISKQGYFSYKFLHYSTDEGFNNQLIDFLNNESFKTYPINPEKKITNIEILFHTKG